MPLSIRVKVTVPANILNSASVQAAIVRAQRTQTAPDLRNLFARTVVGWQNPPAFSQSQQVAQNFISMSVYPSGANAPQYELVNNGSPPHDIFPKTVGGFLKFQYGYIAGTSPRVISSRAYTRFGAYKSTSHVRHRGFKAREFDAKIAEDYQSVFERDMQAAIASAIP